MFTKHLQVNQALLAELHSQADQQRMRDSLPQQPARWKLAKNQLGDLLIAAGERLKGTSPQLYRQPDYL